MYHISTAWIASSLLHSVNILPHCDANTVLSSNVGYPSFLGRKLFIIISIKVSTPTLKTTLVGRHYTRPAPEVGLVLLRSWQSTVLTSMRALMTVFGESCTRYKCFMVVLQKVFSRNIFKAMLLDWRWHQWVIESIVVGWTIVKAILVVKFVAAAWCIVLSSTSPSLSPAHYGP